MKPLRRLPSLYWLIAALAVIACLASSPPAFAGPPIHKSLGDPINGFPLDKACGIAVDSEGNLYVSSAGNDKVEVFDPDGDHLGSISDTNEPCGLAVDSEGELYVSRSATGEVVKYTPTAYPLTVSPSWGAAETIDDSGDAKGISVDVSDDMLYVARGDRIQVYEEDGDPAGTIGEGELVDATGVSAYTSPDFPFFGAPTLYVGVADAATDELEIFLGRNLGDLAPYRSLDGSSTPDGSMDLGADSALGVDPENGHMFVYDAENDVVNEFEATGVYFAQLPHPGDDAEPTAIAVDRSGGASDGCLLVTAGDDTGASIESFAPVAAASRNHLPTLSKQIASVEGTTVDDHGNYYAVASGVIRIFDPQGSLITTINTSRIPSQLAVDSMGTLYAIRRAQPNDVVRYLPDSFPPTPTTSYSAPIPIAVGGSQPEYSNLSMMSIAVNPVNDHLFLGQLGAPTIEFDSAVNGNTPVNLNFAPAYRQTNVAVGPTGEVYFGGQAPQTVSVVSPDGTRLISRFETLTFVDAIAVDRDNGHLITNESAHSGQVVEYESSGSLVGVAASGFPQVTTTRTQIAIDNSGGPNNGNLYFAHIDNLHAYGPLSYGESPSVEAMVPTEIGDGGATLNATVDPNGFTVSECRFDYVTEAQYDADGGSFASAAGQPCAESPAEIGIGSDPVDVHADLTGLDLAQRYRFRIVAENDFDIARDDGLFGPPLHAERPLKGIHYTEAILRAKLDPSGLPTSYRFEYGSEGPCSSNPCESTPEKLLAANDGETDVEVPIFGLQEGTDYHFRLVASNDVADLEGPDQQFGTYSRPSQDCSNAEFRVGRSSKLPDCRAYELVTPGDTGGAAPYAGNSPSAGETTNRWPVVPYGEKAGERLTFQADTTIPGFDGSGMSDMYRANRTVQGWETELFSPNLAENGSGITPAISADLEYGVFAGSGEGTLPQGRLLRTPSGFERVGRGVNGEDPNATAAHLPAGGSHVIFRSDRALEPESPPLGTPALYDRSVDGETEVVSLLPSDQTPVAELDAFFLGANGNGTAVAFSVVPRVGGPMAGGPRRHYVRQDGETTEVTDGPFKFAGLSEDGRFLFYTTGVAQGGFNGDPSGELIRFDVETQTAEQIAPDGYFTIVSADGSTAYFTSEQQLDPPHGAPGEPGLYVWKPGSGVSFVAELDEADVQRSTPAANLTHWTEAVQGINGINSAAARTAADGSVLVFESRADLGDAVASDAARIYRYESSSGDIVCVSCSSDDRGGLRGSVLLSYNFAGSVTKQNIFVPNLTDDGQTVVFESDDRLALEDQNDVKDVYRWQAQGEGDCTRASGCTALISGGQGNVPSYLYGMTPDAHDIFFASEEVLHPDDPEGLRSIYDARVGGGFPSEPDSPKCVEDSCQDEATSPPGSETPGSSTTGPSGNVTPQPPARKPRDCAKFSKQAKKKQQKAKRAKSTKQARKLRRQAKKLKRKAKRCKASQARSGR